MNISDTDTKTNSERYLQLKKLLGQNEYYDWHLTTPCGGMGCQIVDPDDLDKLLDEVINGP